MCKIQPNCTYLYICLLVCCYMYVYKCLNIGIYICKNICKSMSYVCVYLY